MWVGMNTLIALALATPVWGFALQPPTWTSPSILPEQVAQYETPTRVVIDTEVPSDQAFREAHASTMMDWTRATSLATSIAFAVTGVLGFIQFSDEYGFNDRWTQTACATGEAVLDDCGDETPWEHALAAGTSASLLVTQFGISTAVDFDIAARRDGDWRTYEVTRFIALAMGVLQGLGGFLLANAIDFGWADEQADFDTLQAFAGAHMALGGATLGMNVANTILLF